MQAPTGYSACLGQLEWAYPDVLGGVFTRSALPHGSPFASVRCPEFDFEVPVFVAHIVNSRKLKPAAWLHVCTSCGVVGHVCSGDSGSIPSAFAKKQANAALTSAQCRICSGERKESQWQGLTAWTPEFQFRPKVHIFHP